jgi:hypothetical protein
MRKQPSSQAVLPYPKRKSTMVVLIVGAVGSFAILFSVLMFFAKIARRREVAKIDAKAWQLGQERRAESASDDAWKANKNMSIR